MKHAFTLTLVLAVLFASAVVAADKPDFSGQFKLNVSKSDFGQMPAPSSGTSKIDHKEPAIKISTTYVGDQGDFTMEATYSTDGKETVNKIFGDNEIKSVTKWEGAVLVIDSKGSFNGDPMTSKEKWTLSADGKVMTRSLTFSSSMGEGTQTLVFDKEIR